MKRFFIPFRDFFNTKTSDDIFYTCFCGSGLFLGWLLLICDRPVAVSVSVLAVGRGRSGERARDGRCPAARDPPPPSPATALHRAMEPWRSVGRTAWPWGRDQGYQFMRTVRLFARPSARTTR